MRILALLALLPINLMAMDIAAVVNNVPISTYDVDTRVRVGLIAAGLPDTPAMRQQFRTQTLKTIIDETLQEQEIERLDMQPPKGSIEQAFAQMAKQKGTTLPELSRRLNAEGLSIEPLRKQVATSLTWGAALQKRYGEETLVSTQDVVTLKKQLKQSEGQPEVRYKELYISDFGNQRGQAEQVINAIHQRLLKGGDFDALVNQYSESPLREGSGWVLLGTLEPNTSAALKTIPKGKLSRPVRVKGGYALFLLEDKRIVRFNQTAEQKLNLYQLIVQSDEQRAQRYASQINNCATAQSLANQPEERPYLKSSGSLGNINLSELPSVIRQAVATLPVNASTPPLKMTQGYSILTVCNKEMLRSTVAGLPQDNILKQRLRTQKLQRLSVEYMDELRRKSFIDYRNG